MGLKLRVLRKQAGLTLEELAQRAELTRSYVSKLERGLSVPSVAAGLRLAKVLAVGVEELFSASPQADPVVINRAPRGAEIGVPAPRIVSGALTGHRLSAFVLNPTDKPVRGHPMSHHSGEELLFVLKGAISLQLAQRVETLRVGDSAHFNSAIPHKITSTSRRPASVLLIVAQND